MTHLKRPNGQGRVKTACATCGLVRTVPAAQLALGKYKVCKRCNRPAFRHGHAISSGGAASPTYQTWNGMIKRCSDPNATAFASYGGRGILVCDRWKTFDNFLADMGERPPGKTLDRIDNDRGYEPGNCRWATKKEQGANRRATKITDEKAVEIRALIAKGITQKEIALQFGVSSELISDINRGRRHKDPSMAKSAALLALHKALATLRRARDLLLLLNDRTGLKRVDEIADGTAALIAHVKTEQNQKEVAA